MKKIGLISDTHGTVHPDVFELFGQVDLILHAGDVDAPTVLSDLETLAPVVAVRGNMDRGLTLETLPTLRLIQIDGKKVALIHNLRYLQAEIHHLGLQDEKIDAVVHGHTHRAESRQTGGVLYINPGTASTAASKPSVAIMKVDEKSFRVELIPLRRLPES